ncbi:dihydroxy-acid dehydratase [Oscillospiraceae bacterium PP1C4]
MASTEYYNSLLRGDSGALKRALYKSMGFTENALKKPLVALVNSYTNATPGHFNLNLLCEQIQKGVEAAGGTAMTFGTIAPCDGIAEGHEGMRYILPSRDLITSSVECMVRAHKFDGMVLMGSCDKIVPGMLMAAARLDIPAIFINGGPMYPANYKGKHYDGNIITEAIGWKQRGEISEEEFAEIENLAEPCVGSCAMLGTANTMGCLAEAMGMSLPGSATIPAILSERMQAAYHTGEAIMELVKQGVTARQIITHQSIENAMAVLMAIGGSTNGIMHLQAIYHEAGLGDLPLAEFDRFSRKIPQIASIYPASPYDMVDFYEAGGVPAVMKELLPLLHSDALTVTGKTIAENLSPFPASPHREVIKTIAAPFSQDGGVATLTGNLAPLGAVIKPAAVPEHLMHFEGRAQVFHSEQEAIEAILASKVKPNTAVVLRYEGPKGGPGMPEMYRPMKCLEGMGLSDSCAIVTDGRFSGSNRGCFVGHISPEAYEGGTLALVEDGDLIIIDIPDRTIHLDVSDELLEQRKQLWVRLDKNIKQGYLRTYQRISKSAAEGAVVE